MRGYLIAVPKLPKNVKTISETEAMPGEWKALVQNLRRAASQSLEAFLLPADDPRIYSARENLSHVHHSKDGLRRAPTEWARCESRHARARTEEVLGTRRPLTDWQDGGAAPRFPEGGWSDWGTGQTERVLDLMDINFLRSAVNNVDVRKSLTLILLGEVLD
jgi:hypothetical protein